jgi:hypothetical protein
MTRQYGEITAEDILQNRESAGNELRGLYEKSAADNRKYF